MYKYKNHGSQLLSGGQKQRVALIFIFKGINHISADE